MATKKTTGRKKTSTKTESVGPDLNKKASSESVAEEAANLQLITEREQHLEMIDASYGGNLPYDRSRMVNECQFYLETSSHAMLEAGKRLVLLKEHEAHGDFLSALDQIGLAPRPAQRMMQAAIKFSNPNARPVAHLGQTKLLELMVEDDEDIAELAEGGTIAGLTLDDMESMSAKQLRSELRKSRAKAEREATANEKLIAKKDETINKYARDSERVHEWPEIVTSLSLDVTLAAGKCVEHIAALRKLVNTVLEEAGEHNLTDGQIAAIVNPFNDLIDNVSEHNAELTAEFMASLSGYLEVPAEVWTSADEND